MVLEKHIKRSVQLLSFVIVLILLIPFVVDYFVSAEKGLAKNAFVEEGNISIQDSKRIWKELHKQGALDRDGNLNKDTDLDDIIDSINQQVFSEYEFKRLVNVLNQQHEAVSKKQRQIEILGSTITGYDKSKINWKIAANYIYAGRSQYIFNLEDVYSGLIYDDNGLIVIDNIKADKIRINSKRKTLYASDNIEARFLNKSNQQKLKELKGLHAQESNTDAPIIIKSDSLQFNGSKDTVELSKNVKIIQDDVTIYPSQSIFVDNKKNVAMINNGFEMEASDFSVSGNKMTIYINEDRSEMEGNITIIREENDLDGSLDERESSLRKQQTILVCDKARYSENGDKHKLEVMENIVITQADKIIRAKNGVFDEETDFYEMSKDVEIELTSLDWILEEETADGLKNNEVNSTLSQKTTITTDKLTFVSDMKKLTLLGNVVVTQADKVIKANKLVFDDESLLVYCIGNVSVLKDLKNTINTNYLVIDLEKETFSAKDGVSSTYYLD